MFLCVRIWTSGYRLQMSASWTPHVPAGTGRLANVVLMLWQRRRRWPSIKTTFVQRVVFSGAIYQQALSTLLTTALIIHYYISHVYGTRKTVIDYKHGMTKITWNTSPNRFYHTGCFYLHNQREMVQRQTFITLIYQGPGPHYL